MLTGKIKKGNKEKEKAKGEGQRQAKRFMTILNNGYYYLTV